MLLLEKNTELRKLPAGKLCNIVNILETDNDWKKIMSLIPRNPRSEYFEPKYNNEHIKWVLFKEILLMTLYSLQHTQFDFRSLLYQAS